MPARFDCSNYAHKHAHKHIHICYMYVHATTQAELDSAHQEQLVAVRKEANAQVVLVTKCS